MEWLYSIGILILIFICMFSFIKLEIYITKFIVNKVVDEPEEITYCAAITIVMIFTFTSPLLVYGVHEIFFRK